MTDQTVTSKVHSLEERVLALEGELRATRRRRRGGMAALVLAMVATVAVAQVTPTWTVFQAGQPARASDVNGNFALLRQWLEQKVGTVGAPNIYAAGGIGTPGAVSSNSVITSRIEAERATIGTTSYAGTHLRGINPGNHLHLAGTAAGGTYVNFYEGTGGFHVGNGGSSATVFSVASNGNVSATGEISAARFRFQDARAPGSSCAWAGSPYSAAWGVESFAECPTGQYMKAMNCKVHGASENPPYRLICQAFCCLP